ncbi:MerR family transcriptional regulator [Deinococcus aetherius]|uniref:MerR family transcriptional regulator n=1 Tax=Deinococcus aetherius TaxID=200252 RepID=UPI00222EA021|nr:MerR family transcriptional regulator [Deinococcus aetherius]
MTVSIGDFARLGGVSVRMLRHYDHIGLLLPANVDPQTGHRRYALDQLVTLNRVVALKTLGFTLEEVADLIQGGVAPSELRGMLRLRRAQLERQVHHHRHTLERVAARLRLIEQEDVMPETVHVKHIPAQPLAALSMVAPDPSRHTVGPLVQELFSRVADHMDHAGGDRTTPIARYAPVSTGGPEVRLTAGYVVVGDAVPELELEPLAAVEVAAAVHRGRMDGIAGAYQALANWAQVNGRQACVEAGCWREVYLEANGEDQREWLVEVQLELG